MASVSAEEDADLFRLQEAAIDARCSGDDISAAFLSGCTLVRGLEQSTQTNAAFEQLAQFYQSTGRQFDAVITRRLGRTIAQSAQDFKTADCTR